MPNSAHARSTDTATRPREKILQSGGQQLSEAELIALILGSGIKGRDACEMAAILLAEAGGLRRLSSRKSNEVMLMKGIGPARAARLLAAFSLARRINRHRLTPGMRIASSRDVFQHYHPVLRDRKREVFLALLLDSKHRLIREEEISVGSLSASIVHPREVFCPAIRESAAALLALHNHPSGDPTPSQEDYEVTQRLRAVGRLTGIELLDHVILGEGNYLSFREHRLIDWD